MQQQSEAAQLPEVDETDDQEEEQLSFHEWNQLMEELRWDRYSRDQSF